MTWHDGVGSGWNYDGRGARKFKTDRGPYNISNVSGEFPTAYIRELQTAKEGVFTLETTVVFSDGFDGFVMCFYDAEDNDAARIITRDGEYYLKDLNSKNKSYINRGTPLNPEQEYKLNDNDIISLADSELVFKLPQ